jgi:UDPglucose 6-dehydrogenase
MRPVSALTRRAYEGEVLRVRTKMGRRVTCTPDHPFVARRGSDGPTEVVLARDLTEEHWLPLGFGAVEGTADAPAAEHLDLLEWLPETDVAPEEVICRLDEADRARVRELGAAGVAERIAPLGHHRGRDRAYDVVRTAVVRLTEARALGLRLEDATFGTAKNGTYLPRRIPLDERFWRVVGLYLAEGHITADGRRRRLYWSFHPHEEQALVDEVASFWHDLGVKRDVRLGTTTMHVSVSSRLLAALWTDVLQLGADCYTHRIPELAWAQPEAHKKALLAGLWLGDGSWSYVAGGPSVVLEYGTVSRPLADGMLRLLGELELVTRQKVRRANKSTTDTHWFVLSGADQVERALFLVDERSAERIRTSIAGQAKRIAATGYRRDGEHGAWLRVTRREPASFQGFVYSLEVPGPETVVTTGGLVVHNCFPKDVKALAHTARDHGLELDLAVATDKVNVRQKGLLFRKLKKHFDGDVRGRRICVWGLAFKPKTDDLRESPALTLIDALLADGAEVVVHDPEAEENARARYADKLAFCDDAYDAAKDAEAVVLVTEWRQYQNPDFERLKALMARPLLVDGRNIWSSYGTRKMGFTYEGVGVRGS